MSLTRLTFAYAAVLLLLCLASVLTARGVGATMPTNATIVYTLYSETSATLYQLDTERELSRRWLHFPEFIYLVDLESFDDTLVMLAYSLQGNVGLLMINTHTDETRVWYHPQLDWAFDTALSSNGQWIALHDNHELTVYELATQRKLFSTTALYEITAIGWLASDDTLLVGAWLEDEPAMGLYTVAFDGSYTPFPFALTLDEEVTEIVPSPQGDVLALAIYDYVQNATHLCIWDGDSVVRRLTYPQWISNVAWSNDGRYILFFDDAIMYVFDVSTGNVPISAFDTVLWEEALWLP